MRGVYNSSLAGGSKQYLVVQFRLDDSGNLHAQLPVREGEVLDGMNREYGAAWSFPKTPEGAKAMSDMMAFIVRVLEADDLHNQ